MGGDDRGKVWDELREVPLDIGNQRRAGSGDQRVPAVFPEQLSIGPADHLSSEGNLIDGGKSQAAQRAHHLARANTMEGSRERRGQTGDNRPVLLKDSEDIGEAGFDLFRALGADPNALATADAAILHHLGPPVHHLDSFGRTVTNAGITLLTSLFDGAHDTAKSKRRCLKHSRMPPES